MMGRTHVNGFEGSPLDPRYTFDSFVVGPANRMAHAAAIQVAETVFAEERGFNPLYLHASVGLGKTHLQHAIAWEVKRRAPKANVLYLTAERFRYQFVEAIKSQDAMAFKDKFRTIDILLIDDLEFMRGEKTEQEFEHIINSLLDGGRQVVVASARPPVQLDGLNDRMRSRLQRGLVTEISPMDAALRLKVLEKRAQEKRAADPSFEISSEVVALLADRLTESGRELEGAINRLYLTWQLMRAPVTLDIAETIIRDLVQGIEPRRIKIEDILRIVSRHFAVSKQDILSQRRHRSVVRPRQIGMYLAKHLTSRSLPEIGRRFGDRDHTTVLHAIRKIDREVRREPAPQGRDRGAEAAAEPIAGRRAEASNPSARGSRGGRMRRGGAARERRSCIALGQRDPLNWRRRPLQRRASRSTLLGLANLLGRSEAFSILQRLWRGRAEGASAATEGSNRRGSDAAGDRTR